MWESSQADIFLLIHTRNDKQPVDTPSTRAIEKLRKLAAQQLKTLESGASRGNIFSEVMGSEKHGYIQTYSLGSSPSNVWGLAPNCQGY
ncbi:hypothetical protein Ancab_005608 [Ancistrocladus abbreviatus]